MNNLFKAHTELTEDDYSKIWEKGIFVIDTNTLLDLYRLPESAQKDLLNILSNKKIKNRIWIPFQVALEFHQNRLEAISDQKNKFTNVRNIINDSNSEIDTVYNSLFLKLEKLQLKKRHSVINPDTYINDNLFVEPKEKLNKFLKELDELNKRHPDVHDKDELKEKIYAILEGKIGKGFTKAELEAIFKEGELRYADGIPPGYGDITKKGFYLHEDKKILRKFGDLIIWKEIINKAKEENLEYVALITGDIKEDWWQEKRGKKLGPRYELLNEIYFAAKSLKAFHMYDTSGFLKFSKQYLNINVKEQSIIETKDLIEVNKNLELLSGEKGITSLKEVIEEVSKRIPVQVSYTNGMLNSPPLIIDDNVIFPIILEILSNVYHHALDRTVRVSLREKDDYYVLRFSNRIKPEVSTSDIPNTLRGKGLQIIHSLFDEEYGVVETGYKNSLFYIQLVIDKRLFLKRKKMLNLF